MNDPSAPSQPQSSLPVLTSLVKPEQIARITHFDEKTKANWLQGVSKLWDTIKARAPDSPEYQNAYKKLVEVTYNVHATMRKASQKSRTTEETHATDAAQVNQESQANGTVPPNQSRQSTLQQVSTAAAPSQGVEPLSQKVIQIVQATRLAVPPHISQQGPEQIQNWTRDAKVKYAHQLQKQENNKTALLELNKTTAMRQKEGRPFTSEEATLLGDRKSHLLHALHETEDYINKFKEQQAALKVGGGGNFNPVPSQDLGVDARNIARPQGGAAPQPSQLHPEHSGQPHTVSSALDAARNQMNAGSHGAGSPPNVGQNVGVGQQLGHSNGNTVRNSQGQANLGRLSNQHVNQGGTTGGVSAPPQPNADHNSTPQSATQKRPHSLTHQAAMEQTAHLYAQVNHQPADTHPTTHAHPSVTSREHNGHRDPQNPSNLKFTIPKELKVTQPMPTAMGPARPTLTGGPSNGATTSLSQPAIQKHPGYVLEGEGERVLSKKKLEELVRQVIGGGVESEEGETLSAEVEEVHFYLPWHRYRVELLPS